MPLCRWNSQSILNIACGSDANVKSPVFIKAFEVEILMMSYRQVKSFAEEGLQPLY